MTGIWVFDAAVFLSVLVHEVGHALMASILGVRITCFRYGFGPVLLQIGNVEWRLVPITGEVRTIDTLAWWKGILIALAGVMMQWVVVLTAMMIGIARESASFWAWVLGLAILSCLQLVPLASTDGAVALRWLAKKSHSTRSR